MTRLRGVCLVRFVFAALAAAGLLALGGCSPPPAPQEPEAVAPASLPPAAAVEAPPEVAALIQDLRGSDRPRIERAKRRLARLGAPAVPALIELLKQGSRTDRARVTTVLVRIGKDAVPPLVALLAGDDTSHMAAASVALANMGRDAVGGLIAALGSRNESVRFMAAETLGDIGADAAEAVPALTESQEDSSPLVRKKAADALAKIASPSAGPDLRTLSPISRTPPGPEPAATRARRRPPARPW